MDVVKTRIAKRLSIRHSTLRRPNILALSIQKWGVTWDPTNSPPSIHDSVIQQTGEKPQSHFIVATISSIFSIMCTYSVAWLIALLLTNSGWITPISFMSEMQPFFTSIPAYFSPRWCR